MAIREKWDGLAAQNHGVIVNNGRRIQKIPAYLYDVCKHLNFNGFMPEQLTKHQHLSRHTDGTVAR